MLEITEYLSLPGPTKPADELGAVADTVCALGAGRFAGFGTIVRTSGGPVAVPSGELASVPTLEGVTPGPTSGAVLPSAAWKWTRSGVLKCAPAVMPRSG
jgi:hypothetical protein